MSDPNERRIHLCRFCSAPIGDTFVDLGMSPLCESFLTAGQIDEMEPFYPLHAEVCAECLLVQVPEYVAPDGIFTEYAYFSSYSDSWLRHAEAYVELVSERFALDDRSFVVELASNDGYLLQYFLGRGPRILGIEPAANVAEVAVAKGVPTLVEFFGVELAEKLADGEGRADLIAGNNVLAQVPDLNDFVGGMAVLLAPTGVVTLEFPHVLRLIESNQYDTIYHEHFSYFSLLTCERIFAAHGLTLFDVEELASHGGSLRIYLRHAADDTKPVTERVHALRATEVAAGLDEVSTYTRFTEQVEANKRELLAFLIEARRAGKQVVGYGAPGKGNTLLNYCGIRTDLMAYTVDRNPYKHGRYTPGTHIPIFPPEKIAETRPDYVLIMPWNLRKEIASSLGYIAGWGGRLVVAIPQTEVFDAESVEAGVTT
jgi:C-methyltransferase C-terminal domain/Putative zinc binding domain/Methyltransferase domain